MGFIFLKFTYDADLVECPDYIANNLDKYQLDFDKWLSAEDSNHNYWHRMPESMGGGPALCFGSDAFVDWLNEYVIDENTKKAVIIERDLEPKAKEYKDLPHINF